MRRMYGDVKHISVLRTEINNNEIDVDDVEVAAARYSRTGWKKNKYLYTDYQNAKVNEVLTEPYFRPTTSTSSTTTTTAPLPLTNTDAGGDDGSQQTTMMLPNDSNKPVTIVVKSVADVAAASAVYENVTTTMAAPPVMANFKIVSAPNLSGRNRSSETATISTTLRIFLPAKQVASITPPQLTDGERSDIDDEVAVVTESIVAVKQTTAEAPTITIDEDGGYDEVMVADDDESDQVASESNVYFEQTERFDGKQTASATINSVRGAAATLGSPQQQQHQSTEHMEGQLFQDVVQKEAPVVPNFNARGV